MEHHSFRHVIARVLILGLIALLTSAPAAWAQDAGTPEAAEDLTTVELVEQVSGAVVTVINEQTVTSIFGTESTEPAGIGTGFVIDEEGHIVTNWHVVFGGTSFVVVLADGTEVEAELIGEDPRDDIAVVKIDPEAVTATVSLGDSSRLKVGETVVAIGSPLGAFTNSVTQGIVGSLDRDMFSQGGVCQAYTDLIQHDAAINPGNSGGPLFNLRGEVVGVNTLGLSQIPDGPAVQGLSFAVPSNTVATVASQLIEDGHISAPYLGITMRQIDPQLAAYNDLPVDWGVYIVDVEGGGPADEAGIEPDDIIISMDGKEINSETSLSTILFEHAAGDTVDVTVLRGDEEEELSITLGEVPEEVFAQCVLPEEETP